MSIKPILKYIRNTHSHHPSLKDQIRVIVLFGDHETTRDNPLTQREIDALATTVGVEFDHNLHTSLSNLYDAGLIDRFKKPGPEWYVISERRDEIVNGEAEAVLDVDREQLITHIQETDPSSGTAPAETAADGGTTLRGIVAAGLGVEPKGVEPHLRAGDWKDQRERVNRAIEAIEDAEEHECRDSYGRIVLRPRAYRYHIAENVFEIVESEEVA